MIRLILGRFLIWLMQPAQVEAAWKRHDAEAAWDLARQERKERRLTRQIRDLAREEIDRARPAAARRTGA